MKKQFIQFLKDNDAYKAFKEGLKERYIGLKYYLKRLEYEPELYIKCAFTWTSTKQGDVFWYHLHKKWLKTLEQIDIKMAITNN